ncbi:hypothetical protein [Photorhabdus bodei]|uniref:Dopa decarboxylase n=1 Tax=Photorhabdus bodei TaxID=2029681 RepID=A0AAW6BTI1_9GAMM|nr:hypothetical protein [Photorhabdus bodei]MDB6375005.1 hypothetical protein [Photorhabdus bodei]
MNTQNVKTAAPESTERCGKTTYMRTDGFVTNIYSRHPYDVIRADIVIERIEKAANRSCGCYYEIYASRVMSSAMDYLLNLPLKDRPTFIGAASQRGIMLTLAEEERCYRACRELEAELAADY